MKLLYVFQRAIDPIKPNGNQIAVTEGTPPDFNGKLIVGKRAVRCLFVSEASYLTAGQISAFCDPPDW
jgi:hypothetical protein